MTQCPTWCVVDHDEDAARAPGFHRGRTHDVAVVLEGRGSGGAHKAELLVELSRRPDEGVVWVYLGDGWTGFSMSLDSARRLLRALESAVAEPNHDRPSSEACG